MSVRNNHLKGVRHQQSLTPKYYFSRPPTTSDKKDPMTNKFYEVGALGIIGRNPVNGIPVQSGTEGTLYYLSEFDASGNAIWLPLSGGSTPPALTFRDQVNAEVVPTLAGITDWDGLTVAAGANPSSIPLETVKYDANTMRHQIQVAKARTGSPSDKNNCGICCFDDTAFDVDENGYVTRKGGAGSAIDSITIDNNTAPGTNPVVADATGGITLQGDAVAAHSIPVDMHSRAANAFKCEVQVSKARTGAPANKNDVGMCVFDDVYFDVDTNGYVTPKGGASAGFVWREETTTSATYVANEGIFANNAGTVTLTLPTGCSGGEAFAAYMEGAGKVRIAQNASDQIRFGNSTTTSGVGGYIESLNTGDSVMIICLSDHNFRVISSEGSWTIV